MSIANLLYYDFFLHQHGYYSAVINPGYCPFNGRLTQNNSIMYFISNYMKKIFTLLCRPSRKETTEKADPWCCPLAHIGYSTEDPAHGERPTCKRKIQNTSYLQLFDFLLKLETQSLLIFHFALQLTIFKVLSVKENVECVKTKYPVSCKIEISGLRAYFLSLSSSCCLSFSRSNMDSWASFKSPSSFLLFLSRSTRSFFSCSRELSSCKRYGFFLRTNALHQRILEGSSNPEVLGLPINSIYLRHRLAVPVCS